MTSPTLTGRTVARVVALALAFGPATSLDGQQVSSPPATEITMGRLAKLRATSDPGLVAALRASVVSPDPGVRAVAARIIAVSRLAAFSGDVASALARETEPRIAAEQVNALLLINTKESLAAIDAHLIQAQPLGAEAYAAWLAHVHPDLLVTEMPSLKMWLRDQPRLIREAVRVASFQKPEIRQKLLTAWAPSVDAYSWQEVLDTLPSFAAGGQVLIDFFRNGIAHPRTATREATMWQLVMLMAGAPLPDAVVEAALATLPPAAEPRSAWEALAINLIGRRYRGAAVQNGSPLIAGATPQYATYVGRMRNLKEISESERNAIRALPASMRALSLAGGDSPGIPDDRFPALRTVDGIWPGFVRSLLAETGCNPTSGSMIGVVQLAYAPDGTPARGGFDPMRLPPSCHTALQAVATTTLGTGVLVKDRMQLVVLSTQEGVLQCLDVPSPAFAAISTPDPSGRIQEPKLLTPTIKPTYPAEAKQGRIQGLVIVAATITRNGCVRDASVIRSVSTLLDLEALRTIAQWRYSPTLLNGEPVEVQLNVSVNYQLQ